MDPIIEALSDRIDKLETDIHLLTNRIDQLETNIKELSSIVKDVLQKTFHQLLRIPHKEK